MPWALFTRIKRLPIYFLTMDGLLKLAFRLALITVLQFLEELPDRQAADAVRGRIDWKYLLGLPLDDPGFDFTVLSDFRARLVQGEAEQILLDALLALFKEQGWLKERERQRTDSTHILAKVRAINRLLCVGETMRFALNSLAVVAGYWSTVMRPGCIAMGIASKRGGCPKARRVVWQRQKPLDKMAGNCSATCLLKPRRRISREIPAVKILRQVWVQNYRYDDGQLHWRESSDIPPAALAHQFALRSRSPLWQEIQHALDRGHRCI